VPTPFPSRGCGPASGVGEGDSDLTQHCSLHDASFTILSQYITLVCSSVPDSFVHRAGWWVNKACRGVDDGDERRERGSAASRSGRERRARGSGKAGEGERKRGSEREQKVTVRWRGSAVPCLGDSTGAGPSAAARLSSSGELSVALASGGREVAVSGVSVRISSGPTQPSLGQPSLGPGLDRALASGGLASRGEMGGVAGLQTAFTCMSATH
jgi:hypothetical protein